MSFEGQSRVRFVEGVTKMEFELLIPEYDTEDPEPYPGDIKPGVYARNQVVELLRLNKGNPEAVQFIADMLEE
jgi:hypothetical protein